MPLWTMNQSVTTPLALSPTSKVRNLKSREAMEIAPGSTKLEAAKTKLQIFLTNLLPYNDNVRAFHSAAFQLFVCTFQTHQYFLFSNYHFSPLGLGVSLPKRRQRAPSSAPNPPSCNAPIWLAFLKAFA